MLVGQQRLEDAGYAQNEIINELDDGESTLDIEIQLAPWITTKNFVLATQVIFFIFIFFFFMIFLLLNIIYV